MTNLNTLRTAMKRDRDQAQQIEDDEQRQREKEREDAAWKEYLEAEKDLLRALQRRPLLNGKEFSTEQSTKTDNENDQ